MARFNKETLEQLREVILTEPGIHHLVDEKRITLDTLHQNKKLRLQKLTPAPKPDGDIRLTPFQKKPDKLKAQQQERITQTKASFDKRIENRARENVEIFGSDYQREIFKDLSKQDVITLTEHGADAVLEMDNKPSKKQDIQVDKNDLSDLDYNQNIDVKMKLSLEQTEQLISSRTSLIDRFEDNAKDMEVDADKSPPEPSDDFE